MVEEIEVVGIERADIIELETGFEGKNPLYPPAKGEAGVNFGVDAAGFKNIGVDHASAANFVPTGFTITTAAAGAVGTGKIYFETGFSEAEHEWPDPRSGL